jgi:hypothetical protein
MRWKNRDRRLSSFLGDVLTPITQAAMDFDLPKKMGVVEIVPGINPTLSLQPLSQVCVAVY